MVKNLRAEFKDNPAGVAGLKNFMKANKIANPKGVRSFSAILNLICRSMEVCTTDQHQPQWNCVEEVLGSREGERRVFARWCQDRQACWCCLPVTYRALLGIAATRSIRCVAAGPERMDRELVRCTYRAEAEFVVQLCESAHPALLPQPLAARRELILSAASQWRYRPDLWKLQWNRPGVYHQGDFTINGCYEGKSQVLIERSLSHLSDQRAWVSRAVDPATVQEVDKVLSARGVHSWPFIPLLVGVEPPDLARAESRLIKRFAAPLNWQQFSEGFSVRRGAQGARNRHRDLQRERAGRPRWSQQVSAGERAAVRQREARARLQEMVRAGQAERVERPLGAPLPLVTTFTILTLSLGFDGEAVETRQWAGSNLLEGLRGLPRWSQSGWRVQVVPGQLDTTNWARVRAEQRWSFWVGGAEATARQVEAMARAAGCSFWVQWREGRPEREASEAAALELLVEMQRLPPAAMMRGYSIGQMWAVYRRSRQSMPEGRLRDGPQLRGLRMRLLQAMRAAGAIPATADLEIPLPALKWIDRSAIVSIVGELIRSSQRHCDEAKAYMLRMLHFPREPLDSVADKLMNMHRMKREFGETSPACACVAVVSRLRTVGSRVSTWEGHVCMPARDYTGPFSHVLHCAATNIPSPSTSFIARHATEEVERFAMRLGIPFPAEMGP